METTIRAMRRRAFPKIGSWTIVACLTVTLAGLIGTFALSIVVRAPNFCFAGLFFFIQKWSLEVFSIFVSITGILLLCSFVTYGRLLTNRQIGAMERKAASRMVFHMCTGVLTNVS